MNSSSASPALPGVGRVDQSYFRLGHAFLIALVLHLMLLLLVALFPEVFAPPSVLVMAPDTKPPPVRFTFIDVPDDNLVAENPDADFLSDKVREEAGPTPSVTTPEGKLPPSEGNTPEKVAFGAEVQPPSPPSPAAPRLPRTAVAQPPEPEPAARAETSAAEDSETLESQPAPVVEDEQGPAKEDPLARRAREGAGDAGETGENQRPIDPRQKKFSQALDRMTTRPLPTDLQAVAPPSQTPPRLQSGKSTQWQFNNPDPAYPVKVGSISFDSKGADFGPWLAEFHRRVLAEWNSNINAWHEKLWREIVGAPVAPDAMKQNAFARRINSTRGVTGIIFLVTREGSVIDLELIHPSGTVELDRSVQKTLRNVLLPPLPDDFPDAVLPIRAGFYYNVEPPE
ncbi:MAG: hypothetical protein O7D35_12090 [Acidobacteria bacterium]|nr:hypothetical protein [Acidobacteriota bacterium]